MERMQVKEIYDAELLTKGRGYGARERYSIVAALAGTIQAVAGEEIFAVHAGELLLLPPHTFFAVVEPKKEASFLFLSFEAEPLSLEEPTLRPIPAPLAERLAASRLQPERYPLLELLLLDALKEAPMAPLHKSGSAALFFEAAAKLEQDLLNPPSVEALADALDLSLSKLKRIFARYAGMGAHEYLADRRISLAKQCLAEGRSVTETAALCGYANQAYFSAAFKKMVGCSPKEYLPKEPSKKAPQKKNSPPKKAKKKADMPSYLL